MAMIGLLRNLGIIFERQHARNLTSVVLKRCYQSYLRSTDSFFWDEVLKGLNPTIWTLLCLSLFTEHTRAASRGAYVTVSIRILV